MTGLKPKSLKETFQELLEEERKRWAPFFEAERRLQRFVTTGNAGGAVASLSVIATIIGTSQRPIPAFLFWAFIAFVVGLLCSLASLIFELTANRAAVEHHYLDTGRAKKGLEGVAKILFGTTPWLLLLAALCLVTGAILGVWQLYQLVDVARA